jgi:hypothetical protein
MIQAHMEEGLADTMVVLLLISHKEWWMGRGARNSWYELRARPPAESPHHAPALPRDTPRENRENRAAA